MRIMFKFYKDLEVKIKEMNNTEQDVQVDVIINTYSKYRDFEKVISEYRDKVIALSLVRNSKYMLINEKILLDEETVKSLALLLDFYRNDGHISRKEFNSIIKGYKPMCEKVDVIY